MAEIATSGIPAGWFLANSATHVAGKT